MTGDNPLDEMYTNEPPYDREHLVEVLSDFIQVDKETGGPSLQNDFHLATAETQVTSLLLYRHIAAELGELEEHEIPVGESWLNDWGTVDEVVPGFWQSEFVEEEDAKYVIPPHGVEDALTQIEMWE
jgi:hypothetical protein